MHGEQKAGMNSIDSCGPDVKMSAPMNFKKLIEKSYKKAFNNTRWNITVYFYIKRRKLFTKAVI